MRAAMPRAPVARVVSPPPLALHFLGTASMAPSASRNVSGMALQVRSAPIVTSEPLATLVHGIF